MKYEGKLLLPALLVCIVAAINAQVKCNDIAISVAGGWCKGQTVTYRGCFDATKPDSDETSAASFIALNQEKFKEFNSNTCLTRATSECATYGGKPRDGGCTDVDNECKTDNLVYSVGVGACLVDSHCTGFAQSSFVPCCEQYSGWIQNLRCQGAFSKLNYYIPPQCSKTANICRLVPTGGAAMMRAMGSSSISIGVFVAIVSVGYSR
jgi:hypothetical protein